MVSMSQHLCGVTLLTSLLNYDDLCEARPREPPSPAEAAALTTSHAPDAHRSPGGDHGDYPMSHSTPHGASAVRSQWSLRDVLRKGPLLLSKQAGSVQEEGTWLLHQARTPSLTECSTKSMRAAL